MVDGIIVGRGGKPLGLAGGGSLGASGLLRMLPGAGGGVCAIAGSAAAKKAKLASKALVVMAASLLCSNAGTRFLIRGPAQSFPGLEDPTA